MDRRRFLGLLGAGLVGGRFAGKDLTLAKIDSGWSTLSYGTDLKWVCNNGNAWNDEVTVGNGEATLRYRRANGLLYASVRVKLGTTTSFPNTGWWHFQLPDSLAAGTAASSDTYAGPQSGPLLGIGTSFAYDDSENKVYLGVSAPFPNLILPGGVEAHPVIYSLMGDPSTLSMNSGNPFTWAVDDSAYLDIVTECFDN